VTSSINSIRSSSWYVRSSRLAMSRLWRDWIAEVNYRRRQTVPSGRSLPYWPAGAAALAMSSTQAALSP
jgi:hypothetical protein